MHGHGLQPPSGRPQSNEFHNFTQWGQEIRKYPCFHCTFNLFKQCLNMSVSVLYSILLNKVMILGLFMIKVSSSFLSLCSVRVSVFVGVIVITFATATGFI